MVPFTRSLRTFTCTMMTLKYQIALFCLAASTLLQAQTPLSWTLLPGIEGGPGHSLARDPETGALYIAMVDGLYRSVNEGDQWEKVLELGQGSFPYRHQYEVDAWGGRVAVLRFEAGLLSPKLFYSENLGVAWDSIALPAGTGSTAPILHRLALFEDWILLNFGDGEGVYYSKDKGHTWTEPEFFQQSIFSPASPPPLSLIRSTGRMYLYAFPNIYYTDGDPEQWDTLPLPPGVTVAQLRFANESRVLITNLLDNQCYASTNTGQSWTPVSLHQAVAEVGFWYGQKGDTLLTGAGPVYRSVFPFTDALPENGLSVPYPEFIPFWTEHYLLGARTQEGDDNGLYAFPGRGVFRIRTDGQAPTYSQANSGLPEGTVRQLVSSPKGMIAHGPTGIFRYQEAQQKWDTLWLQTEMPAAVSSVAVIEDTFWIVANSGVLYKAVGAGAPFQKDLSYILYLTSDIPMQRVEVRDGVFYLFNLYRSLYSLDSARTWKPIEDPWPFDFYRNIVGAKGHFLINYRNPFGELECYMTHDWGATWTYLPEVKPDTEDRIYYNDGRFYAFDERYLNGQPYLWLSLDNGLHWTTATGLLPNVQPILGISQPVLFSSGSVLYFSQGQGNFCVSGDFGASWTLMNNPGSNIPAVGALCMGAQDGNLYLGTGALGSWRSKALVGTQQAEQVSRALELFPNPAGDYLWLRPAPDQPEPYTIRDALGREVARGVWDGREGIYLGELAFGGYFIGVGGFGGWFFRG